MRVKTDARRSAIIQAAWQAFRENGFERTTMSDVSARVGGSKATLYSYFGSKEELFFAAIEDALQEQAERAFGQLSGPGDLRRRLLAFAHSYMDLRLDPDAIAVGRMLIGEAERSTVCETLRVKHYMPKWQRVAAALQGEMDAGRLRRADPYRAAIHLRVLFESDLIERRLYADPTVTSDLVETEVREGVDAFLRAYAPES